MAAVGPEPGSLAQAAAALRRAAAELDEAAWREGIAEDGALGPVVRALRDGSKCAADMAEATDRSLREHIEAILELAEVERDQLRLTVEGASVAVAQMRQAQRNLEVERELVVTRLVENLGPHLAEGLKHWRVIRESELTRRRTRRAAVVSCFLTLAVLFTGYAWRSWQVRGALASIDNCLAQEIYDQRTGESYCKTKGFKGTE
jgi:hypothetical protein